MVLFLLATRTQIFAKSAKFRLINASTWVLTISFQPLRLGTLESFLGLRTITWPHVRQYKTMQIITWLLSLQNQESTPMSPDPFLALACVVGSGNETNSEGALVASREKGRHTHAALRSAAVQGLRFINFIAGPLHGITNTKESRIHTCTTQIIRGRRARTRALTR